MYLTIWKYKSIVSQFAIAGKVSNTILACLVSKCVIGRPISILNRSSKLDEHMGNS